VRISVRAIQFRIRSFNRQAAHAVHRVAGIDDQIENGTLELMHIYDRAPETSASDSLQLNSFAERPSQKLRHICYTFVCIRRLGF